MNKSDAISVFSVDNYKIKVFVGQPLDKIKYYRQQAVFIDDKDLKNHGTEVYVVIEKGFESPDYAIIAFKTDPVGYAAFSPVVHYERESQTLFIGAGTMIKTYRLADNTLVFQKDHGFGFWSWGKYKALVIQQEETAFGVFNMYGEAAMGNVCWSPV